MLIVSQHMLRETELEAPEAYRGKVRLYSIRYKSDDCGLRTRLSKTAPSFSVSHLPPILLNANYSTLS